MCNSPAFQCIPQTSVCPCALPYQEALRNTKVHLFCFVFMICNLRYVQNVYAVSQSLMGISNFQNVANFCLVRHSFLHCFEIWIIKITQKECAHYHCSLQTSLHFTKYKLKKILGNHENLKVSFHNDLRVHHLLFRLRNSVTFTFIRITVAIKNSPSLRFNKELFFFLLITIYFLPICSEIMWFIICNFGKICNFG